MPSGTPLSTHTTNVPKRAKTSIPKNGTTSACKLVTVLAIALLIANRKKGFKVARELRLFLCKFALPVNSPTNSLHHPHLSP